jgi:hypothetical protein
VIRSVPLDSLEETLAGMNIHSDAGFALEDLVDAVKMRRKGEASKIASSREGLRAQEYEALIKGRPELSRQQDFVCIHGEIGPKSSNWLERIMVVKRLREARVLQSFTRLLPPGPGDPIERRATLYDVDPGWLPGIEVIGEGVFFLLNPATLSDWEKQRIVQERASVINRNYKAKFERMGLTPDREVTPRLLLVHTLAHAMINQWSLESGYPAASLRERLFASELMAGLLVYTATTDSAGSLGGVIAQAEPERLDHTLAEGIARASWCSADPICIEAEASGVDSLNLAACHACCLLPEVSCEERNLLLDRALLVGTRVQPKLGFFAELLKS